jgi:sigma-B regulation protein RsbU (phosphoserine phosphatase)
MIGGTALPELGGTAAHQQPLRVLVVDDSKAQRKLLAMSLSRWGFAVTEAVSAEEGLALCGTQSFDIILSDWMMDGMSGLEFCRTLRGLGHEDYAYFILLTSKSEKAEIANGLEAGADDFLTKPVTADELRARLRAGERIIAMQQELVAKNRLLGATVQQLRRAHDALGRDLVEARRLQQALVRDRFRDWGSGAVTLFLRPSGHVGGDLVGFFEIGEGRVGIYSVDVSGHGVASAMMTARLAGYLSGQVPGQNLALRPMLDGRPGSWPPEDVAARLNRTMLEDLRVDQYFTMAYAEVSLADGHLSLVQAGHPHPLILRADGGVERLGDGGLPIGLIAEARHDRVDARLNPGDRLLLLSDGFTECPGRDGAELGEDGLITLLRLNRHLASQQLLDALVWDLAAYQGSEDFPDDISGLVFDYRGS